MDSSKKINLLFAIGAMHHGGAERVIASLCKNLDTEKFTVTILWRSNCGAIGDELKAQGINVIGIRERFGDNTLLTRFLGLRKILQALNIDIIHTHDTGALTDAVHCRLSGSNAKVVHTFHFGNYPHKKRRGIILDTVYSRFAHQLIAVGIDQAARIIAALNLKNSSLRVLYNGVQQPDRTKRNLEALFGIDVSRGPIIGSISTLTEQKGLTILIDAAGLLRDRGFKFSLIVAGDGPLRQDLEAHRDRLDLGDRVHFAGWVPNAANQLLGSLDIFCQSSLWEANSIVLLEAMATGLPIVATNVGESSNVLVNGQSGIVVERGNAERLADGLAELIENVDQRKTMGAAAKERYEKHYTIDRMTISHQQMYENLLAGRALPESP